MGGPEGHSTVCHGQMRHSAGLLVWGCECPQKAWSSSLQHPRSDTAMLLIPLVRKGAVGWPSCHPQLGGSTRLHLLLHLKVLQVVCYHPWDT